MRSAKQKPIVRRTKIDIGIRDRAALPIQHVPCLFDALLSYRRVVLLFPVTASRIALSNRAIRAVASVTLCAYS